MLRATPPRDRADVRGRLVVEPAEAHLGERARGRGDRVAALLGRDARVRRAPEERRVDASTGDGHVDARSRRSARRGRRRSRCARASCEQSSALAPRRPISSCDAQHELDARVRAALRDDPAHALEHRATAALLSPPRIVVARVRDDAVGARPGSIGAVGSTVSMCAQRRIGVPRLARGRRDAADDVAGLVARAAAAASSCGSRPRSRR